MKDWQRITLYVVLIVTAITFGWLGVRTVSKDGYEINLMAGVGDDVLFDGTELVVVTGTSMSYFRIVGDGFEISAVPVSDNKFEISDTVSVSNWRITHGQNIDMQINSADHNFFKVSRVQDIPTVIIVLVVDVLLTAFLLLVIYAAPSK